MNDNNTVIINNKETIGKYDVVSIIGRGGMGIVYKAYDPLLDSFVAIKMLHKTDQQIVDRFIQEGKVGRQLNHPNLASIYEILMHDNKLCLVMEYIEGKELNKLLNEQPSFTVHEAIDIIVKLLDIVDFVHKRNIIHRDLKPENIFVLKDKSIKLLDFGIAHVHDSGMTMDGMIMGTFAYMSPEQCQGKDLDVRSDLFSIGVILYELLTGERPFQGKRADTVVKDIINRQPIPPSALNKNIPPLLEKVISKALHKSPERRFHTAEEFKQALGAIKSKKNTKKYWIPGVSATLVGIMTLGLIYFGGISFVSVESKPDGDGHDFQPATHQNTEITEVERLTDDSPEMTDLQSSEQNEKVRRLLSIAKLHFLAERFVSPRGSNAYEAYRIVLDLDPNNAAAIDGINKIADRLLNKTLSLHQEGESSKVKFNVLIAQELFPEHKGWISFINTTPH